MTLLLMSANVQNRDDKLGFSDTATDVLALDIVPNENPWYKKCHVKVLNIGDTSNQSSNSANSLFKDTGRVNGFWNTLESRSKNIKVNTSVICHPDFYVKSTFYHFRKICKACLRNIKIGK